MDGNPIVLHPERRAGELCSTGGLPRKYAFAMASLNRELSEGDALRMAVFSHQEQVGFGAQAVHADDAHIGALLESDPEHAARRQAHRPDFLLLEADRLPGAADHQDLILSPGDARPSQDVSIGNVRR
jgi:hypothetical protein